MPPESGWNAFAEFIKKQGIDLPLRLSFDPHILFDPDEEAIASKLDFRLIKISIDSNLNSKLLRRPH